jgi:hypothetical protein
MDFLQIKHTRHVFFVLIFLSATSNLHAQIDKEVKVKLKNGVKINGGIVKSLSDEFLELDVSGSDNIVIMFDHIRTISFKNYGHLRGNFSEKLKRPPKLKINTFYHELRGGLMFGEENVSGSIQTINGYKFTKYLGSGLGVGLNKFGNTVTLPIYAAAKGYLFDKKVTPFYFGDIGYGIAWHTNENNQMYQVEEIKGGLYWQVGLGYQINFYNSAMTFSLGYVNQKSSIDYFVNEIWRPDRVEVSENRILRRIVFSVGFLL